MWAPPPRGHPPPYQPYTTHVAVPPYPSPPYAPPQSGIIAHYPPCGVMPHARQMLHASPHMAVPPPLHTLVPHVPLGLPMPPSAHSAHSPGMPHSPHVPNSGGRGRGSGKGGSGKDTPGKGVKGRGGSGKGKGRSGGDGGTVGWELAEHAWDGVAEHTAQDAVEDDFDEEAAFKRRVTAGASTAKPLETPEQIATYQEARRRNWPTRANVERKAAEEVKRVAVGGLPQAVERLGGRGRRRGGNWDGGGRGAKGNAGGKVVARQGNVKGKGGGKGGGVNGGGKGGRRFGGEMVAYRPYWQAGDSEGGSTGIVSAGGALPAPPSDNLWNGHEGGGTHVGADGEVDCSSGLGMLSAWYADSEEGEGEGEGEGEEEEEPDESYESHEEEQEPGVGSIGGASSFEPPAVVMAGAGDLAIAAMFAGEVPALLSATAVAGAASATDVAASAAEFVHSAASASSPQRRHPRGQSNAHGGYARRAVGRDLAVAASAAGADLEWFGGDARPSLDAAAVVDDCVVSSLVSSDVDDAPTPCAKASSGPTADYSEGGKCHAASSAQPAVGEEAAEHVTVEGNLYKRGGTLCGKGGDARAAEQGATAFEAIAEADDGSGEGEGVRVGGGNAAAGSSLVGVKRPRACVHFLKGHCRYGESCRYSHDAEPHAQRASSRAKHQQTSDALRPNARPSLLQALLAKEVRAERSVLLQCVRRLVSVLDDEQNAERAWRGRGRSAHVTRAPSSRRHKALNHAIEAEAVAEVTTFPAGRKAPVRLT